METSEQKKIFLQLKTLLKRYVKNGVVMKRKPAESTAKGNKPQVHLYGTKKVSVFARPEQQMYLGGIIMQKNFVGFYLMGMYTHPAKLGPKQPALIRMRKGKSCINITKMDPAMLKDLDRMIREGISLFRKEKWI